jgi:twitching motility two-component system response regulator PilH
MAILGMLKRLVNAETADHERRADERVRTTLGARVLVVDDSATIRAVLAKMLAQDGYEVMKAADGEIAIEMAQSQVPDLIFLDIVLPGMSGFSVLRALRREDRTRATPIIMMSGNQQATEQFYVQRFGADSFIRKPFGRAEVFHAIRALVRDDRMPARALPPPLLAGIPEGISAEEWAAIPDVAMPDGAQVPAREGSGSQARPAEATVPSHPGSSETAIQGVATSVAMRPTLAIGTRAVPAARITIHLDTAVDPVTGVAAPSAGKSAGQVGAGSGN